MTWQRWTPNERGIVQSGIERGDPYTVIVGRIKRYTGKERHVASVRRYAAMHNMTHKHQDDRLTSREVAALFNVAHGTIGRWATRGWITATAAGSHAYSDEAILAFIENADGWMAWTPEQITDADYRAYAQECRRSGPRWLTLDETAQRLGVSHWTVRRYLAAGLLPFYRHHAVYIREDHVAAFVPPCERR